MNGPDYILINEYHVNDLLDLIAKNFSIRITNEFGKDKQRTNSNLTRILKEEILKVLQRAEHYNESELFGW